MQIAKKKKNILLIGISGLTHYRLGMFNLLCDDYDVTIAHTNDKLSGANFTQLKVVAKKIGPFYYITKEPDLAKYDIVIFSFNIRVLNLYKALFFKKKYKVLLFGIGVSASYNTGYDERKRLDFLMKYILRKSDGAIFYDLYPLIKYKSYKINPNKLHVAYNTVLPPESFKFSEKTYETFIFIGTLYKEKKIYDLLNAYLHIYLELKGNTPALEVIGNGDEFNNIMIWINENGLKDKVLLHGELTDENELAPIFKRSIVCISPGQAGLSVQKCFSYGTPFVTTKNAITGGELFCILDNVNGFLYDDSIDGLSKLMLRIANKEYDIEAVSRRSYDFYYNYRTPFMWKYSFIKAIENK